MQGAPDVARAFAQLLGISMGVTGSLATTSGVTVGSASASAILQANAKPLSILIGTGRVVSNIAQPPSGCCRTAVEIALDNVADTRDVKGFHQLFILGHWERLFKAYGQLAAIPVSAIG